MNGRLRELLSPRRKGLQFSLAHVEVLCMAQQQTSNSPHATDLQVIRLLTTAAEADTVYRDLYLQRAAARLSALLSKTEYEQLRGQNATIENLLAQTRRAVDRQDWAQVQELTVRATGFRHLLEAKRG